MKITVHILKRDRTIDTLKVSRERPDFEYNGGLYQISPENVNIESQGSKADLQSSPELYYLEDNPYPLNFQKATPKDQEKTRKNLLNEIVLINALSQLGGEPGKALMMILKAVLNPLNMLIFAFVLIIVVGFFQGLIPF